MANRFIKSFALALLLCVFAGASIVDAQTPGSTTVPGFTGNGPATATLVKGRADVSTITCPSAFSISDTACSDTTYAGDNQCVTANCGCIKWNCTERNALAGNGTATVEINVDVGNGNAGGTPPDCYPIFGEFDTASTDVESTAFSGVVCDPVSGKLTTAPLTGGWELTGWDTTKITDGAGGNFTGTLNFGTGELKMTLKGRTF